MVQAVMAKSEAASVKILDSYKKRLTDSGLGIFKELLQKKYDADPKSLNFYNNDPW
jgi:hypothetical protein